MWVSCDSAATTRTPPPLRHHAATACRRGHACGGAAHSAALPRVRAIKTSEIRKYATSACAKNALGKASSGNLC